MSAVSELGRRQRSAFLALSKAVSIAFGAAPSMAWDSTRLPPQSSTAIATVTLFFSAQAVQPSTRPRAPAELMTFKVRKGAGAAAKLSALADATRSAATETSERRARMESLPGWLSNHIKLVIARESDIGTLLMTPTPKLSWPANARALRKY